MIISSIGLFERIFKSAPRFNLAQPDPKLRIGHLTYSQWDATLTEVVASSGLHFFSCYNLHNVDEILAFTNQKAVAMGKGTRWDFPNFEDWDMNVLYGIAGSLCGAVATKYNLDNSNALLIHSATFMTLRKLAAKTKAGEIIPQKDIIEINKLLAKYKYTFRIRA